jgi:hypothetical protein
VTDAEIIAKYEVDGLLRGKTVRELSVQLADAVATAEAASTAVDWRCPTCDVPSDGLSWETIPGHEAGLQLDVVLVEPCKHRILVLP